MREKKEDLVRLSADEFMTKHSPELEESEDAIAEKQLASVFPEGPVSLSWLMSQSPERDKWQRAREAIPGFRLIQELRGYWLVRLLKAAEQENSPEAFRELLQGWMIRLGVEPPDGVFVPPRRPRGAPRKQSTEQIYRTWLENDRPDWGFLAYKVYGAEYTRAGAHQRKKHRDRCRLAVQRFGAKLRDENHSN